MANAPNVVSRARLARWLLLAALVTAGILLYFRAGVGVPTFGSGSAVSADSTR
jgi:hypothetical protein